MFLFIYRDMILDRFGGKEVFGAPGAPTPSSQACREMPKDPPGTAQMNPQLRAEQPKQRVSHLQTPQTIIGI